MAATTLQYECAVLIGRDVCALNPSMLAAICARALPSPSLPVTLSSCLPKIPPMLLTATQQAIADSVREFAQERIRPHALSYETARAYPPAQLFEELRPTGVDGRDRARGERRRGRRLCVAALALMEIAAADGALSTILWIQNSLIVSGLDLEGRHHRATGPLPARFDRRPP